jgi:cellulose synthase/poly-beta-1,6-N-acetylglucosamine synthase-like glycosyltransferase
MCFAVTAIRDVPHQAFSIVEDLEYGIRLGLAGHRIHYAAEAEVRGDMAASAEASKVQRRRWEGGRLRIARQHALTLLRRGVASPDRVLLDLGLDLATPPLAYLAAAAVFGTAVSLLTAAALGRSLWAPWAWSAALAALVIYVGRGWQLSGTGWRGLADLAYAPVYLTWKIGLALGREKGDGAWTRTPREKKP